MNRQPFVPKTPPVRSTGELPGDPTSAPTESRLSEVYSGYGMSRRRLFVTAQIHGGGCCRASSMASHRATSTRSCFHTLSCPLLVSASMRSGCVAGAALSAGLSYIFLSRTTPTHPEWGLRDHP